MKLIREYVKLLKENYDLKDDEIAVIVISELQRVYVVKNGKILKKYVVSTAKNGMGNKSGSYKTPTGALRVKKKIGKNAEYATIFKGRINTNRIAVVNKGKVRSQYDHITTRILWLEGLEEGFNRGGDVDTFKRYIYFHGTPDEGLLGTPASYGCIRMSNTDIIEFFDIVPEGTLVYIQ